MEGLTVAVNDMKSPTAGPSGRGGDDETDQLQTQTVQEYDGFQRSSPTGTNPNPNILNPAVRYGGIDPENEDNVHKVDSVVDKEIRSEILQVRRKMLRPTSDSHLSPLRANANETSATSHTGESGSHGLLQLPSELVDEILSYLTPTELCIVTQVCKTLHRHADADFHWQRHVSSNLPGNPVKTPYPCETFRELYISHDPYWFIPKHKIWFCDRGLTGQLMIVQYDQRRGVIEGYQLLAVRNRDGSEPWLADQEVHIHYFEPVVKLHRDKPLIKFNPLRPKDVAQWDSESASSGSSYRRPFCSETRMLLHQHDPRLSNIILAKPLNESLLNQTMMGRFPYGHIWPPPQIPARHRVGGNPAGIFPLPRHRASTAAPSVWYPKAPSEASDQAFRVRQRTPWCGPETRHNTFTKFKAAIADFNGSRWMEMGPRNLGMHLGEELVTWSTLDPALYTPTPERPWRGIWVGDYSGHGCEFLLINQPDLEGEDAEPLVREEKESEVEFQDRFRRERVHKGRLEAIKLTGDPNVPRGEYTFMAKDLGEAGLVGVAQEPPFQGARVVRSVGHIAALGFLNDKFIESQLLLISHNRLAQYWVGFGHISFFERVNIDGFLVP